MDQARVIRVEIDPAFISVEDEFPGVRGLLHDELQELRQALTQEGGLAMFQIPEWFHRSKKTVTNTTPPPSETTEFHRQVAKDMKDMLDLLNSMAVMIAAWKPPNTNGTPSAPPVPDAKIGEGRGEVFYLIQS